MYIYSDLKDRNISIEPSYTRKHFYKKISIFNDNNLEKSIIDLKESVEKKNIFLQKYNDSQKILNQRLNLFNNNADNKNIKIRNSYNFNSENVDFISNEDKRRKNYHSTQLKNIFSKKGKNIENSEIYSVNSKIINKNTSILINPANVENNNDENKIGQFSENIMEKIKGSKINDNSYKILTNLNINSNTKNNLNKSPKKDISPKSENSSDYEKILDDAIENIQKVYTLNHIEVEDKSKISNIYFKKIPKKTFKEYNKKTNFNNKISNNQNFTPYNTISKRKKSNSFSRSNDNSSITDEENKNKSNYSNNYISHNNKFLSKKEKHKSQKIDNQENSFHKELIERAEMFRKIKEKIFLNKISNHENVFKEVNKNKNINNCENNQILINFNNNNNNYPNKKEDPLLHDILDMSNKKKSGLEREKTPQKIKMDYQKIFNSIRNDDFYYKEISKDDDPIKALIIKLLNISSSDTDKFKYHKELSKDLIVKIKDKFFFWKNIIEYIYSKIFLNKLEHKRVEKRILGEGLFKINIEDFRYHKKNKKLQLELRNSIKDDNFDEFIFDMNKKKSKFSTVKENKVIDRNDIFRSVQHSNFSSNAEKYIKPSTLKKINRERKIKMVSNSRHDREKSQKIFGSNSSNSIFNVTNFNYMGNLIDNKSNYSYNLDNDFNENNRINHDKIKYSKNIDYFNNENQLNQDPINLDNNYIDINKNKISPNYSIASENIFNSNGKDITDNINKSDDKVSKIARRNHISVDLNSEINEISRIHPINNNQNNSIGIHQNNYYFNSYNNESIITNLENSSNFNFTEIDKRNINKKINKNNEFSENIDKVDTNKNIIHLIPNPPNVLINCNRNNQISNNIISNSKSVNNIDYFNKKIKIDKNFVNKFNKNLISNSNQSKNQISFLDVTKVNKISQNYSASNFANNNYENFKNNKDVRKFKLIAPMLINPIPRYDL